MLRLFPEHAMQYWSCSRKPARLGYSGVACLVRPTKDSEVIEVSEGMGAIGKCQLQTHSADHRMITEDEGRLLTLELPRLILVNVYVPNSGAQLGRLDYRVKVSCNISSNVRACF